jgi:hypothetical protein
MRHVREHYGLAMYEAQVLEQYLAHAILAATDAPGANFERIERKVRHLPMGALARRFTDAVAVPAHFIARLNAACEQRNWLAHRYFAGRSDFLGSSAGRALMMRELDEVSDEFYRLWGVLDAAVVAWFARGNPQPEEFSADFECAVSEA